MPGNNIADIGKNPDKKIIQILCVVSKFGTDTTICPRIIPKKINKTLLIFHDLIRHMSKIIAEIIRPEMNDHVSISQVLNKNTFNLENAKTPLIIPKNKFNKNVNSELFSICGKLVIFSLEEIILFKDFIRFS